MTPPWYVLTGGPCSGKTTLVNELKARGYSVLSESARTVIAAGLAQGKSIHEITGDALALERLIIAHQQEIEAAAPNDSIVFLDRGIIDNIAYCRKFGVTLDVQTQGMIDAATYRGVFLLDLIEFANDAERYETPEEAADLHRELRRAYEERKFDIVEVPVLPISERADFILKCIKETP